MDNLLKFDCKKKTLEFNNTYDNNQQLYINSRNRPYDINIIILNEIFSLINSQNYNWNSILKFAIDNQIVFDKTDSNGNKTLNNVEYSILWDTLSSDMATKIYQEIIKKTKKIYASDNIKLKQSVMTKHNMQFKPYKSLANFIFVLNSSFVKARIKSAIRYVLREVSTKVKCINANKNIETVKYATLPSRRWDMKVWDGENLLYLLDPKANNITKNNILDPDIHLYPHSKIYTQGIYII
jgi:hypothetical protein